MNPLIHEYLLLGVQSLAPRRPAATGPSARPERPFRCFARERRPERSFGQDAVNLSREHVLVGSSMFPGHAAPMKRFFLTYLAEVPSVAHLVEPRAPVALKVCWWRIWLETNPSLVA